MSEPSTVAMDWDTYWRGSADGTAFGADGVDHPLVRQFWVNALGGLDKEDGKPSLLDVASGRGAVIDVAHSVLGEDGAAVSCLDTSEWAIKSLLERFPLAEGHVGDAMKMPFSDGAFDIATSQFGVEYAGLDAVDEMARVIAPGGKLLLLMHLEGGVIDQECSANIDAIDDLQRIGFLPAATRLFTEGRKCIRGETDGSRDDYDAAVQDMMPVFKEFGGLIKKHGDDAAGGTLATLYRETDRIYSRIMHHDLDEVLQWLDRMGDELQAYTGRMQSMCDAANDTSTLERLADKVDSQGFSVLESGPLLDESSQQNVAWQLIAQRDAD